MKKILIIERESAAIAPLKIVIESLNIQPSIHLSWTPEIKTIPLSEVVAVFLNVEMPRIDVKEIVNYFITYSSINERSIPVYFLISQKHIEIYEKIKQVKHAGKLSKPFKLEEIYFLLEQNLDLLNFDLEQYDPYYKLTQFRDYSAELKTWIESLKTLMKK